LTDNHPLFSLIRDTFETSSFTTQTKATQNGYKVQRFGYLQIEAGISNQRRLRVTKGVYLPADTPMHGIFGSKDVIHSWAIPGLGVKIDCIPGYSSHRRLLFR